MIGIIQGEQEEHVSQTAWVTVANNDMSLLFVTSLSLSCSTREMLLDSAGGKVKTVKYLGYLRVHSSGTLFRYTLGTLYLNSSPLNPLSLGLL